MRTYDGIPDRLDHLYRSTDGGRTWLVGLDANALRVGFSSNYAQDHTLYAAPVRFPVSPLHRRRRDLGNVPLASTPADSCLPLSGRGGRQHAVPGAVWRAARLRSPAGFVLLRRWRRFVGAPGHRPVNDIALSPRYADDRTLFVARTSYKANYGLFKSTDGGHTWAARSEGLYLMAAPPPAIIVFSPGYPADPTLFCRSTGLAYRSTDAGDSWQQVYPQEPPPGPPPWGHGVWVLSPYFLRDRTAWIDSGRRADHRRRQLLGEHELESTHV